MPWTHFWILNGLYAQKCEKLEDTEKIRYVSKKKQHFQLIAVKSVVFCHERKSSSLIYLPMIDGLVDDVLLYFGVYGKMFAIFIICCRHVLAPNIANK